MGTETEVDTDCHNGKNRGALEIEGLKKKKRTHAHEVLWDDDLSAGSLSVNVTLVRRFKLHIGVGHKFQMDRYLETPTSMGLFL